MLGVFLKRRKEKKRMEAARRDAEIQQRMEAKLVELRRVLNKHPRNAPVERKPMPFSVHHLREPEI